MVLEALRRGRVITPLDALHEFNSLRLGSIIYDLRQEGFDIGTEINQQGKHYAKYYLKPKESLFE